ncbi:uncharacterized protein LOC142605806 [Castanea sativa]|uniref:uncharacterized protein LOC142605806 n=1 Tax=Castanea sativa TaxID=21020 RepID=UPI003F64D9AA
MDNGEKEGGSTKPIRQMTNFCDAVNDCHLRDLGYVGHNFTWSHKFGNRGSIRERFNRALVSTSWAPCFPSYQVYHLANSSSNHCILLLKDAPPQSRLRRRKKLFRFEAMWLKDEACTEVVKIAWDRGLARDSGLSRGLSASKGLLKHWMKIENTRRELNMMLDIEEAMEGVWQVDVDVIKKIFVDYYKALFTSANPMVSEELLSAIHPKVAALMNSLLTSDFRKNEVERALKQIFPTMAPGPDGMPPFFYQQFWPIVGNVVIKTALDYLNLGITPPKCNETHIVLIPKVKDPKQV